MKTRKKKRRVRKVVPRKDKATAVWADIEIFGVEELSKERVKLIFKAHFSEGNPMQCVTMWKPPRDTLSMFSVVRRAGVPIEKTEKGYSFKSQYLVGVSVKQCAIKPDKNGRVRLWHPEERERIMKTGEVATPAIL